MKMSIKWHRECLRNMTASLATYSRQLQQLREQVARLQESTEFYELQIEEACKQGKDGFDGERFMVKRK